MSFKIRYIKGRIIIMNPKSNKVTIPLSAPLNLSKLTSEVVNFSGWNDINSPYYGKCISPLYEKKDLLTNNNVIYTKNGDIYTINGGTLNKNEAAAMSCTPTCFTDTKLYTNTLATALSVDSSYLYINYDLDEDASYGMFNMGNTETSVHYTKTVFTSGVFVAAKCAYDNGNSLYSIVYQNNNTYYLWLFDGTNEKTQQITWYKNTGTSPTAVTIKPNQVRINCSYNSSMWLISVLSDSGTGLTSLGYFNIAYSSGTVYTNWTWSGSSSVASTSKVSTYIGVYTSISNILTAGSGYSPVLSDKKLTVSLTHAWTYPINVYVSDNAHVSSSTAIVDTNLIMTIPAGSLTATASIGTATYADGTSYTMAERGFVWITTTDETTTGGTEDIIKMVPTNTYGIKTVYTSTTVSSANREYGITLYGSLTSTLNYGHSPDVIFDDGYAYCLGLMGYGFSTMGIIPFKSSIGSTAVSGTTLTINYSPTVYYEWTYDSTSTNIKPRSYVSTVIDIGQGFAREMIRASTRNYDQKYDSGLSTDVIVCFDSAVASAILNPGVNTSYRNNAGSLYQIDNFRLLYTNGIPAGISYGESGSRGTLVSEWYCVSSQFDISCNGNYLTYMNTTDGFVHLISLKSTSSTPYQFVENRYIVMNTISYFNCYDTYTGNKYHYADDFNNRVLAGSSSLSNLSATKSQLNMVSAVNANYEISKVAITSIGVNPQSLSLIIKDHETFISSASPNSSDVLDVDVYYGEAASSYATYYCSAKIINSSTVTTSVYNKSALQGAYSPITTSGNVIYSPSIFTTYITSYTNNDMILSNITGYMLIYSGTTPILAYYLLSGLENITNLFIIQSMFYAIVEDKIVKLTYNNGVIASNTAIVDVTGMQYIGALPDKALFFSTMNKTIYSFTGDCNLAPIYEANKIDSITGTYYNTATQSIYLATTGGLYIINSNSMFELPLTGVANVFFIGTNSVVVSDSSAVHVSYYPQTGYTLVPITLATQFYGAGNEANSKLDAFLIRLYNNGTASAGTITLSLTTLTDAGFTTEAKKFNILAKDWDESTGSLYLRYQPQYQACVGASLSLTSSFAISSIVANYTIDTEQIAKFNI
jgi:hypothetical protein